MDQVFQRSWSTLLNELAERPMFQDLDLFVTGPFLGQHNFPYQRDELWLNLEESVGTLKDRYVHNVPLPQVPRLQSASIETSKTHSNPTTGIPLPEYSRVHSWIPTLPKIGNILRFRQKIL